MTDDFDQEVTGEKLRQMLWNFEYTLPIDNAKTKGYVIGNLQFSTFMTEVIKTIKENYHIYPLEMAGYIRFIKEMCEYILEETELWPEQEFKDPNRVILEYQIQTNQRREPKVDLEVTEDNKIKCMKNAS